MLFTPLTLFTDGSLTATFCVTLESPTLWVSDFLNTMVATTTIRYAFRSEGERKVLCPVGYLR